MRFSKSLMMPTPDLRGVSNTAVIIQQYNRIYDDYYYQNRFRAAGISDKEAERLNIGLYKTLCMEMVVSAELLDLRVALYRLKLKELRTYTDNLELYCKQYRKNLNVVGKQAAPKLIARASRFSDIVKPYRDKVRKAIAAKLEGKGIKHPEIIILAYSAEILARKASFIADEVLTHLPGIFPEQIRKRFDALDYKPMKKMITTFRRKAEEICGKAELHHAIRLNNAVKEIIDCLNILEKKERENERINNAARH